MEKIKQGELEASLLETVRTSALAELPADFVDAFAGFPIANALIKLYRGSSSIRDYLFQKKVVNFVSSIATVSPEKRQKQFDKMLIDPAERQRFAEQLLVSLERIDDARKAKVLGNLAVGLVSEEITLLEFWRMSRAVEDLSLDEEWPILQVIEEYKGQYYDGRNTKRPDWNHEDVLRRMVNDKLSIDISDGDLRSIVMRISQNGLFGPASWRRGPAHDCDFAPWYFKLKHYVVW